jgi:hypothetical protein
MIAAVNSQHHGFLFITLVKAISEAPVAHKTFAISARDVVSQAATSLSRIGLGVPNGKANATVVMLGHINRVCVIDFKLA